MNINLISVDNGVGLTQDMAICKSILHEHKCTFHDVKSNHPPRKADINIFFEILNYKFYPKAKVNLFFPNPEWFWFNSQLKGIDLVLCKTIDAQNIFNKFGCRTLYTSFTSRDLKANTPKKRNYIHLAGQSTNKGTNEVIQAWGEDMPELILCSTKSKYPARANINPIYHRLSDQDLIYLLNETIFHVCPSDYEGFGHYIWEAKSCGGIVITTDGEPMSQFVNSKDGFKVKVASTGRQQAAILKRVSVEDLHRTILNTTQLTDAQIRVMQAESRKMWEQNDRFFKSIFTKVIDSFNAKT